MLVVFYHFDENRIYRVYICTSSPNKKVWTLLFSSFISKEGPCNGVLSLDHSGRSLKQYSQQHHQKYRLKYHHNLTVSTETTVVLNKMDDEYVSKSSSDEGKGCDDWHATGECSSNDNSSKDSTTNLSPIAPRKKKLQRKKLLVHRNEMLLSLPKQKVNLRRDTILMGTLDLFGVLQERKTISLMIMKTMMIILKLRKYCWVTGWRL